MNHKAKFRKMMRLFALLWRNSGNAQDLKIAIASRKQAALWS